MGASGRDFDPICPVMKQEFDIKFLNADRHGFIVGEANSEHLLLKFKNDAMEDFYSLRIFN